MATKKETVTEEIVETVAQEETPVVKKSAPRKFAPDDMITCRSITYGELLLTGTKSKLLYSWANYGDTTEVEFQDLQALKSTRSSYLFRPRFIIEDEELIEQWGKDFGDMYKDTQLIVSAYIYDGNEIYYLSGDDCYTEVSTVSYNEVLDIAAPPVIEATVKEN